MKNWLTFKKRSFERSFPLSASSAVLFFSALVFSSSAVAVNYDDPNLSDRRDIVSKAALICSQMRELATEFQNCLQEQGVTDRGEIQDAALTVRATTPSASVGLMDDSSKDIVRREPASSAARTVTGAKTAR